MRIGFDVAQTCVERAGCAWYADSLARALANELSPEDELILYHHFGSWLNADTAAGTQIGATNVRMPLRKLSGREAKKVWADPDHRLLGGPDIVHANSYRAPRVKGARLVYTIYDVSYWTVPEFSTDENRLACQAGTLEALQRAEGFIFISHSAREEFDRVLPGWLSDRGVPSAVIPLGARGGALMRAASELAGDAYWLAVGNMEPRKNYAALLQSIPTYRSASTHPAPILIAGGDGWESESLKTEIAKHEADGSVRRLGYVKDEILESLYRNARGLIFPSWYEGFGLPVLEALARGCPVICSDRTSLREVGGDAVQFIDPSRPESIAHAMLCLENAANIESIRTAGRARAEQFSWSKTARQTMEFYQRVLKSPTQD
jgi:alpha-1,3-rhamnosyl/mannosyltransferase